MVILLKNGSRILIHFRKLQLKHLNNFSHSILVNKKAKIQDDVVFQYKSSNSKPNRRVYVWGMCSTGALGNLTYLVPVNEKYPPLSYLHKPGKLKFSEIHKVKDLACGYGYTVITIKPGKNDYPIFGSGLNTDCQIGYHCERPGHPLQIVIQPVPINLELGNSSKVTKVACGRSHTVIVTDCDGVFTVGNNSFGQCGRPVIENEDYSKHAVIHRLTGIDGKVIDAVCGQDHTLLLTEDGRLYGFGLGSDGQTGLGHFKCSSLPQLCKGDISEEKIIQVSSSTDCALAINEKGELFGWGNSEYGQLKSVTSQQQVNTPKHLAIKHVGKILHSAAGGSMCGIVNDSGQVYVWGFGILGKGPQVSHIASPEMLPEPLFGKNEINTDVKVQSIYSSLDYFAAITDTGDLYTWGKNSYGKLGIGTQKDQFFPLRVSLGGKVSKVSLGPHHMAAVTKAFV